MATQVKMPQLGETVVEGTITRWLKREGETVAMDEPLVEVSTDKVDSEIPSPAAGVVSHIHAGEGETVTVGSVIAEISAARPAPAPRAPAPRPAAPQPAPRPAAPQPAPRPAAPQPAAAVPAAPPSPAPRSAPAPARPTPTPAVPAPAPAPRPAAAQPVAAAAQASPTVTAAQSSPTLTAPGPADGVEPLRGVLSPIVRKLAGERGVDLATLRGTGTGGRITKQDVLAATPLAAPVPDAQPEPVAPPEAEQSVTEELAPTGAEEPTLLEEPEVLPEPELDSEPDFAATAPTGAESNGHAPVTPAAGVAPAADLAPAGDFAPAATGSDEVVQVSHMRKAIAEHMVASHLETARAWNTIEIDMTRIFRLRSVAGPVFKEREGFSLTWMPFVAKAVTQALLKYPAVNATWNGDGTITRKHYVNLGVAVALENGLIVPVLKNADGMNLVGLARSVRDLAQRARSRRLVPDDVQGGTFTITNPGPFGSIISVPIINRGQAGILAFDAVTKRPVVLTDAEGNDSIAVRHMVFLSISWDHRVIDGAEAAKFLAELKALLEQEDFSADLSAYLPGA